MAGSIPVSSFEKALFYAGLRGFKNEKVSKKVSKVIKRYQGKIKKY